MSFIDLREENLKRIINEGWRSTDIKYIVKILLELIKRIEALEDKLEGEK